MSLTPDHVTDLVVATLATYQYNLEKAWSLRDALRAAGLTEPDRVAALSVADLGNALKAAGYDRGGITYIIAPRVKALMVAIRAGELDPLPQMVALGERVAFAATLCAVKGFGPQGAAIAWALMAGSEAGRAG